MLQMNLSAGQEERCRHREWTRGQSRRKRGWDKLRELQWHAHTTTCRIGRSLEAAVWHRELSLVLGDDLEGWDVGRSQGEGI